MPETRQSCLESLMKQQDEATRNLIRLGRASAVEDIIQFVKLNDILNKPDGLIELLEFTQNLVAKDYVGWENRYV